MANRTIMITKPYHLETRYNQLILKSKECGLEHKIPIEDIGFLVIENQRTGLTIYTLQQLAENNVAVIFCNDKHSPSSLLLTLDGHHLHQERFRSQLEASKPLHKQLWQQTIKAKITNQSNLLKIKHKNFRVLDNFAMNVLSGDTTNREALAAKYYWRELIEQPGFVRERFGSAPNPHLNYCYTILRAATARALIGVGLLPTLGIHHHNRYNDFCLADDIMEPYRPYVDRLVLRVIDEHGSEELLSTEVKSELLGILTEEIEFEGQIKPLVNALNNTASSLRQCFEGCTRKIVYPKLCI